MAAVMSKDLVGKYPDHDADGCWNKDKYHARMQREWEIIIGHIVKVEFTGKDNDTVILTYRGGKKLGLCGDGGWHDMGSGVCVFEWTGDVIDSIPVRKALRD
jgi:hypothetical protein